MPLDPSTIYNSGAQSNTVNPLQSLTQVAGVANTLQKNKLMQIAQQREQIGISADQASLAMQHYKNSQEFFAPLAADPNLTDEKILNAAKTGIRTKLFTPEEAAAELSNVPRTPEERQAWAADHLLRIQSAADQLKTVYGQNQDVNTGAGTVMGTRQSPLFGGVFTQTGSVNNELSPGEKVARYSAVADSGAKGSTSVGENYDKSGNKKNSSQNQGFPDENIQTGQSINAPKSNVTPSELPPGEAETMERGAAQGSLLRNTADNSQDRKALLDQMAGLIKTGDFSTGPGADKWKDLAAGLQRPFGIKSQSVSNQEEFGKLASQIAQQQFKVIGGTGTDEKLASAMSTSPNTAISNLGNEKIIALLKGNEDAIRVKNQEWQDWKAKNGAGSYDQFAAQFSKKFHPGIFQAQYMSPDAKKTMTEGMSPQELAQFKTLYQNAGKNGWVQ